MERINLDSVLINGHYKYFAIEYAKLNKKIELAEIELNDLSLLAKQEGEIKDLINEFVATTNKTFYSFMYKHPIFYEYLKARLCYEELVSRRNELVDSFKLDDIVIYRNCKHVFGDVYGKLECLSCSMNENDLKLHTLNELEVFKDILIRKGRYAGKITDEEMSYMHLIHKTYIDKEEKVLNLKK